MTHFLTVILTTTLFGTVMRFSGNMTGAQATLIVFACVFIASTCSVLLENCKHE